MTAPLDTHGCQCPQCLELQELIEAHKAEQQPARIPNPESPAPAPATRAAFWTRLGKGALKVLGVYLRARAGRL